MAQRSIAGNGGEVRDIKDETPLHRQLVSAWIPNGRITSQGFKPTRKDKNVLSLSHGEIVTPEESMNRHRERGYQSDAVATVTGGNCRGLGLEPIHDAEPTPEHVSVPFPPNASNAKKNDIARRLAAAAELTAPPK